MKNMAEDVERLHLSVTGTTHDQLGRSRGRQLRDSLAEAYDWYARIFRAAEVSEEQEQEAVEQTVSTLRDWRPGIVSELEGVADGACISLRQVVALNARTEILALGVLASKECSTIAARVGAADGGARMMGAQTWDWHVELGRFWHTHAVAGPGHRFVGMTEQGLLSKIGVNSAGLALHFNILGHEQDGPGGVPMHVLSGVILTECATVGEAIELVRSTPLSSSSSFTLIDRDGAVSLELSPVGVYEVPQRDGSVVRTNSFQTPVPLAGQKAAFEPDSSARSDLIRTRLAEGLPRNAADLLRMLKTSAGEPPVTCRPDMSKAFGERWATLCTCITVPEERTIRILDGMPTEAESRPWYTFTA